METQIKCPKCGSTQLTANKKGFSGRKAVAGAVLTGGIGLLAGTLGSNKIRITCLACGKQFAPGEGRVTSVQPVYSVSESIPVSDLGTVSDPVDKVILQMYRQGEKLGAVKYYKDETGTDLRTAKEYVENLAAYHGIERKGEAGDGPAAVIIILIALIIVIVLIAKACNGNSESVTRATIYPELKPPSTAESPTQTNLKFDTLFPGQWVLSSYYPDDDKDFRRLQHIYENNDAFGVDNDYIHAKKSRNFMTDHKFILCQTPDEKSWNYFVVNISTGKVKKINPGFDEITPPDISAFVH